MTTENEVILFLPTIKTITITQRVMERVGCRYCTNRGTKIVAIFRHLKSIVISLVCGRIETIHGRS